RRADGGFAAYWRAEGSSAWDSLPALAALARAREAQVPIDDALLDGARDYAVKILADPSAHERWCGSDLCKAELRLAALDALSAAGDRRTTFLGEIDAQRARLAFADQARLARLLSLAPGYETRAASLAKLVEDHLSVTAQGAAVTLPARYRWRDAPVVAQAEALRLVIVRRSDGEMLDRLTRSLLDLRRNGSFGCACETAAALGALVDLAAQERPAAFTATATLAGKTIARERFAGARTPARSASVAMRDLPAGRSELVLAKDGSGTLHYAVTYRYRIATPAAGAYAGLRVTRVVRPASAASALGTMGLAAPAAALELPVARVFDVELQIVTDHPVARVVIADPLPAGLEAVDTTFATTSPALRTPSAPWRIGDQQIRAERVEAYADALEPGIYRLHYLVRSVTPGTFAWPGAQAHLADRPEELGRAAAVTVVVR
ncbi:MAG TPA: alpha-2-macroglobulin family protein, partial [Candidatus Limnocylindria bacterium]|nr:alpha-2-macroglobulin family protein [Candidatus Limnocylindria bacterium]